MRPDERSNSTVRRRVAGGLAALAMAAVLASAARAGSWAGYAENAQHTALAGGPSQLPQTIRWSTPVDLAPQYAGNGDLYTHYGSPVITAHNTVVVPVKTQAQGGFEVLAIAGASGNAVWTFSTDYVLPPHNWIPPMGITLTPSDLSVVIPGAGGSVWVRNAPDLRKGAAARQHFLGLANYNQNPAAFNSAIQICTPLTADSAGNIYFGFQSNGAALPGYPNGVPSGLARLARGGSSGSHVAASSLTNNSASKVAMNCAPALSGNGTSVYVACNSYDGSAGYLCKVSGNASLTSQAYVFLKDPKTGNAAVVLDDGTSSPTVGPDGDVYYGVLESNFPSGHHDRGWLLHFDAALKNTKIPGSFGWDMSPAIVPASLVGSYTKGSSYLVLTKYNDYSDPGIGGSGQNKVAVLDPNNSENDPVDGSGVQVMQEVVTVVGPTPNPGQAGVREWCINSAAVDEANQCAVVNSEDGHVYRWSFNNAATPLSPGLKLANPTGEAYTPTVIGPDGAVYAINNATLCCCVASPGSTPNPTRVGAGPTAVPLAPPTVPAAPLAVAVVLAMLIGAGLAIGAATARRRWLAPVG